MAARRCSMCGINWPVGRMTCGACNGRTDYVSNANVSDADIYGQGGEYELRSPDDPTYDVREDRHTKIVAWRIECFEGAGFSPLDATTLAVRRDIDRVYVNNLLAAGATHAQARDIVL